MGGKWSFGISGLQGFNDFDPVPEPAHHVDRHAVAERLVAWPVRRPVPAAPGRVGIVVGEALQAFAFAGGEAPDGRNQWVCLLRHIAAGRTAGRGA